MGISTISSGGFTHKVTDEESWKSNILAALPQDHTIQHKLGRNHELVN